MPRLARPFDMDVERFEGEALLIEPGRGEVLPYAPAVDIECVELVGCMLVLGEGASDVEA